jgi:hypothetical protein
VTARPNGVLLPDATALRETAETLDALERHGDNFGLNMARSARAVVLAQQDGPEREEAFELFAKVRHEIINDHYGWMDLPNVDTHIAAEKARTGDLDVAVALARSVLDGLHGGTGSLFCAPTTTVLVQALLARARSDEAGYREFRDRYPAGRNPLGLRGIWRSRRRCHDGVWVRALTVRGAADRRRRRFPPRRRRRARPAPAPDR